VLDFFHQELAGPVFAKSSEDWFLQLIERIERLNSGFDERGEILLKAEAASWLANIGRQLYRELFPQELRYAYRHFRHYVRTIMIITDDPWIPWELIKPYDDSDLDDIIDDDFLCLQFQLARWLPGAKPLLPEIRIQRFAFLGSEAFPCSGEERELLRTVAGKHSGVEDVSPGEPTMAALENLLDVGDTQLLHFAGGFEDRAFRPEDLHGPRAAQLRRDHPLVFFNLNDKHADWARRWVEDCGCGALLYPVLRIKDSLAYEFAATFYDALDRRETFGRAVQEARRRLYALEPGIPTWLAYTFYGHVNGQLRLGDS
jgi:hypothetical protein